MSEGPRVPRDSHLVAHDVERHVIDRYARGAERTEVELCCPSGEYAKELLEVIPEEILAKDYGCGDPSRWAEEGDVVVDLGSGPGKICYILSQRVGRSGEVIGVDFNTPMLALARKHQASIAERIGYLNTRFVKARIQDLALDLERAEAWLAAHPARDFAGIVAFESECERLRREETLLVSDSADLVVSNCVLNLVRTQEKSRLFAEIFRVLRRGGRAVISDIVCDEPPTARILADPELWSGCIAGAFCEDEFLRRFEEAGFHGVEILARSDAPWRVIDGVEFRSMTVRAYKGKQGPCFERNQAVVYRGPWKQVLDDDGHAYARGERMAVCEKTFRLLTSENGPYAGQIIGLEPREVIPLEEAAEFDCRRSRVRTAREMKGADFRETGVAGSDEAGGPCSGGGCC